MTFTNRTPATGSGALIRTGPIALHVDVAFWSLPVEVLALCGRDGRRVECFMQLCVDWVDGLRPHHLHC